MRRAGRDGVVVKGAFDASAWATARSTKVARLGRVQPGAARPRPPSMSNAKSATTVLNTSTWMLSQESGTAENEIRGPARRDLVSYLCYPLEMLGRP